MKKYLLLSCMMLWPFCAKAQMMDLLGSLAVEGAITSNSAAGLGKMQQTLSAVQVQQDLAELNLEIQTRYMGNYRDLNKSELNFSGLNGLSWDVGTISAGKYYILLSGLDGALCNNIYYNHAGAERAEVNGGSCQNSNNTLKLIY